MSRLTRPASRATPLAVVGDSPLDRIEHLRDYDGAPYFASLEILGPDRQPIMIYKQRRLIRRPANRAGGGTPGALASR